MFFNCPGCQQRLEIENDQAGEYLPCPACERVIRVPRAPMVINRAARPAPAGVRLVSIPASARVHRKGSLAERVAALKAAQFPQEQRPPENSPQEPMLL